MKIIAVVVTYNRLELLKRNLDCLKRQETPLAAIVVVDNGATDGTHEWLDTQARACFQAAHRIKRIVSRGQEE